MNKQIYTLFTLLILSINSHGQSWEWANKLGSTSAEYILASATDQNGDIYTVGNFSSTMTISGNTIANVGNLDMFIAKYNNAGTLLWLKSAGSGFVDEGQSVSVDTFGNVYVTGHFSGSSIQFGSTTLTNAGNINGDMYIAKYDANGNNVWAKRAGGILYDEYNASVIDNVGNIYVLGTFVSPTVTIGTDTLTNPTGNSLMAIVKYDPNGNVIWSKQSDTLTNSCVPHAIAIDSFNNIFVTGTYSGTTVFGVDTLQIFGGGSNMFVAKYSNQGTEIWCKSANAFGINATAEDIYVDANGSSYITGYFSNSSMIFGQDTLYHFGTSYADIFTVKYDANGNPVWAKSANGDLTDVAKAITGDNDGNIYIGGYFASNLLAFNSLSLTNGTGSQDLFITKYSNNGTPLWTKKSGASAGIYSLSADQWGNIFASGFFSDNPISFDNTTLTNAGGLDAFVAKFGSSSLSINNLNYEDNSTIFPNPFSYSISITTSTEIHKTIKLYNIISQIVIEKNFTKELIINTEYLINGIYIYEISELGTITSKGKLIKN